MVRPSSGKYPESRDTFDGLAFVQKYPESRDTFDGLTFVGKVSRVSGYFSFSSCLCPTLFMPVWPSSEMFSDFFRVLPSSVIAQLPKKILLKKGLPYSKHFIRPGKLNENWQPQKHRFTTFVSRLIVGGSFRYLSIAFMENFLFHFLACLICWNPLILPTLLALTDWPFQEVPWYFGDLFR